MHLPLSTYKDLLIVKQGQKSSEKQARFQFSQPQDLLSLTAGRRLLPSAVTPKAPVFQVGERLGRYEVEKRCAVEREDYDLAKQKKQQMEEYRLKVYQQLELHNLLDPDLTVGSGICSGAGYKLGVIAIQRRLPFVHFSIHLLPSCIQRGFL